MIWNRSTRPPSRPALTMFEELEQRTVLYQTPMVSSFVPLNAPTPLETRQDSIVRILTNVGFFDIELFDASTQSQALRDAAANFRAHINNGKFDESFLHSLGSGQLAGGAYKYDDSTGLSTITAGTPAANGLTRSNLAQTLSFVPINGSQITNQFIINLQDNVGLDTASGGYPVFGKVLQGWTVVQAIAAFTARDLNVQLTGNGTGPFGAVPTTPAYNPAIGPRESTLVKVIDVETIKATGPASYYGTQLVFPEGQRTSATTERIDLVNADQNNINYFQVIVRYDSGDRDAVIYSGSIPAGGRFSLTVNDANNAGASLVRSDSKYSLDVRSTRNIAASINHTDSGVQFSEAFYQTPLIPVGQFKGYTFGNGQRGPDDTTTLVVQNLSGVDSVINVLIYPSFGSPILRTITVEAFRRGSLDFAQVPSMADGSFSVWTTSTQAFSAAITHVKNGTGVTEGDTGQGVQGVGRVRGALAGGYLQTGGEAYVDLVYTGNASFVIVDLVIKLTGSGGTLTPAPITLLQANPKATLDLSTVPGLPRDAYFSITYSERQTVNPVALTYRAKIAGDEVATPFQIASSTNVFFADGFTNPTLAASGGMSETISIFNPYTANSGVTQTGAFTYGLRFHFGDGTYVDAIQNGINVFGLASLARVNRKATDFTNVAAKIASDPAFYHYSVEIIAAIAAFPTLPIGGVVAQLTRIENGIGQSVSTIPSYDPANIQFHGVVYLDNPEFGT